MSTVRSSPDGFSLSVAADGVQVVVAPSGDLDLVSSEVLEREVRQHQFRGAERIVVDLRGVGFLDSTGLRVLLSLRNDAKRNHHSFSLIAGRPAVQRVFALTATRGLFDWRP
ncbi:MAG: hypothetical protein QOF77_2394 [Solirubrobacteraceae bacterium]|jgi:anti-anti-sigma factor|nr:hypothetical protein [Solirubrobacteraceae bacterium]